MASFDLAGAWPTLPTTPELVHGLKHIDDLIAVLRTDMNADDLVDVAWLRLRRREIAAALAWRHAQKGRKIVSLAVWRSAGLETAATLSNIA